MSLEAATLTHHSHRRAWAAHALFTLLGASLMFAALHSYTSRCELLPAVWEAAGGSSRPPRVVRPAEQGAAGRSEEPGEQCAYEFTGYHASALEQKWLDNAETWRDSICEHLLADAAPIHTYVEQVPGFVRPFMSWQHGRACGKTVTAGGVHMQVEAQLASQAPIDEAWLVDLDWRIWSRFSYVNNCTQQARHRCSLVCSFAAQQPLQGGVVHGDAVDV